MTNTLLQAFYLGVSACIFVVALAIPRFISNNEPLTFNRKRRTRP